LVEPAQPVESSAATVNSKVPDWLGVPERTPFEYVIPLGNAPAKVREYGPAPPDAENVTLEYAAPTVPEESEPGTIVIDLSLQAIAST
jgi:hypothetical protein